MFPVNDLIINVIMFFFQVLEKKNYDNRVVGGTQKKTFIKMIKKAIIKKVLNLLLLIYYSNLKNTMF